MSRQPVINQIERGIVKFIKNHPGVVPVFVLLDIDSVKRTVEWIQDGGESAVNKIGLRDDGSIIVYGLTVGYAPKGSGVTIVGYTNKR